MMVLLMMMLLMMTPPYGGARCAWCCSVGPSQPTRTVLPLEGYILRCRLRWLAVVAPLREVRWLFVPWALRGRPLRLLMPPVHWQRGGRFSYCINEDDDDDDDDDDGDDARASP